MPEQIWFVKTAAGAVICRCFGDGKRVILPAVIAGLPVIAIADHCFAKDRPSFMNGRTVYVSCPDPDGAGLFETIGQIDTDTLEEVSFSGTGNHAGIPEICTMDLEEIELPESMEEIGAYAFYGCRSLRRIYFPASVRRMGRGVFVAVNRVRELEFEAKEFPVIPSILSDVLDELSNEVRVILKKDGEVFCDLVFPEYYEESIENTPARIIEIKYQGSGFQYRQCLRGQNLDLKLYDSLRNTAAVLEDPQTVARLCLGRLRYPCSLSAEDAKGYVSLLAGEEESAKEIVFNEQNMQDLKLLWKMEFFTEERLDSWITYASEKKDAEAVSFLMDCRRSRYGGRRRRLLVVSG